MNFFHLACASLITGLVVSQLAFAQTTQPTNKIRIALVGDSTVTEESGWGKGFKVAAGDQVEVLNFAKGGRSSKSFRKEGHWKPPIESGASYMLIQFGHNDQPGKGPDRETDAQTTFRENMGNYVKEARAAGMKVVLVTSMVRRKFKDEGKIRSDLLPYVEGTQAVAKELDVPLIDLHDISIKFFNELGEEKTHEFEPVNKKKNEDNSESAGYDSTHLNEKGSIAIGKLMASAFDQIMPGVIAKQ